MARRRSYLDRTHANTRGAKLLAAAFVARPVFVNDEDGNPVRQWRADEMQTYTVAEITQALRGRRAHESFELLEFIPPSAIKYCVSRGWLVDQAGLYFVTEKAAADLHLPRTTPGMSLKFLKVAA
ncbi:MAG TPA: hypothetical protein VIJ94_11350 [Caulobacteraceae bacterium]